MWLSYKSQFGFSWLHKSQSFCETWQWTELIQTFLKTFTEPKGSLPCSQQPTSGHYPEPDETSQHLHPVSWKYILIYPLTYLKAFLFLRFSLRIFMPFLPLSCALNIYALFFPDLPIIRWGPEQHSWHCDLLLAAQSRNWILMTARLSAPIQTGPRAHPASYTMGARSLSWK